VSRRGEQLGKRKKEKGKRKKEKGKRKKEKGKFFDFFMHMSSGFIYFLCLATFYTHP
jgi:hypothetical protein